ncbi:MAG TPA: hypothetical protein VLF59_05830 [Candidatus Saccharimonadales bacterium]|nr:hypothetical protein [Candidatus Saccharimonadales bacterium]
MGNNDAARSTSTNMDDADLNDAKAMTTEQREKMAKLMADADRPSDSQAAM